VNIRPTAQQLAWQRAELSMFLHFGVNTFTDREWGDGSEDPGLFRPDALDATQWVQAAREAGFRYVILTAKHHDGFCLWPTRTTEHSVRSSSWKEGKGDVVGEFARACHEDGLKIGLYLSPWDRHEPCYGDSPAYNRFFQRQLAELLTEYGEVAEVWFDGACGEGPNGRRQEYDWHGYYEVVRRLQPEALIAICGPDIRWVGNEDGFAAETEWSVREPDPVFHAGASGPVWWPAECDVSIRPGWFWHHSEDEKVKPLSHLMEIYYQSVGRNSVLLLNVPPNARGLLADPDVAALRAFRQEIDQTFAVDLARGRPVTASSTSPGSRAGAVVNDGPEAYWSPAEGDAQPWLEIDLGAPVGWTVSMLQEPIAEGQRVERYQLDALTGEGWKTIATGTTIGQKKLDRFPPVRATKARLTLLGWRERPMIARVGVFGAGSRGAGLSS
jgi:alpha-L-fucosidase